MPRILATWVLLPAILVCVLISWTSRVAIEHIDDWWQANSQKPYMSLISFSTIESRGYTLHPQVDISDVYYENERFIIYADRIYLRLKVLRSLLHARPIIDGWVSNLKIAWHDDSGRLHEHAVNQLLLNSHREYIDLQVQKDAYSSVQNGLKADNKVRRTSKQEIRSNSKPNIHVTDLKVRSRISYQILERATQYLLDCQLVSVPKNECGSWITYNNNQHLKLPAQIHAKQLTIDQHVFDEPLITAYGYWHDQLNWSIVPANAQFNYLHGKHDVDFRMYRVEQALGINVSALKFHDVAQTLLNSSLLSPTHTSITTHLSPQGRIENLYANIRLANERQPLQWEITADLFDVQLQPTHGIPGTVNTNGYIHIQPKAGDFYFYSTDTQLHFATIYEDSRLYPHVSGSLHWIDLPKELQLDGLNIKVTLPTDQQVMGSFLLSLQKTQDWRITPKRNLKLYIDADVVDIPSAMKYIPSHIYKEIPTWLSTKDNPGLVRNLSLKADIPVDRTLLHQMKLKVDADIENASIFVPPGISVQHVQGEFHYIDKDLRVAFKPVAVELYDTHWTTSTMTFYKSTAGKWRLHSQADYIDGDILYSAEEFAPLQLDLHKLFIPSAIKQNLKALDFAKLKETMPRVKIRSEDARYATVQVEALGVTIEFEAQKMLLTGINFFSEKYEFGSHDSQVVWTRRSNDDHTTSFSGAVLFCNVKKLIHAVKCKSAYDHHTGQLYADLIWHAHPLDIKLENISGNLRADISNSTLETQGNTAALQFIELLNLSSILWNPIGSLQSGKTGGIKFQILQVGATLDKGKIIVPEGKMVIVSRGGEFHIDGTVDLNEKTIDGSIGLILPVSDNLGWIGWILGATPLIGISTEILRQTFKKDLDKLFTVRYKINGPLDDIKVSAAKSTSTTFIKAKDKSSLPNLEKLQIPPHPSP